MLNISKSTIHEHFMKLDRLWVPHDLTEKNLDRISICDSLYKRNEETPFLKQVVTGEKWIIYNNVERKRSWGKWNEPSLTTQKPVFIQRRSCSVSGGIGKRFCIISFYQTMKR